MAQGSNPSISEYVQLLFKFIEEEQKFWQNVTDQDLPVIFRVVADRYVDIYHTTLDKISDPRTTHWPMMDSPVPTLMLVLTYLYIILLAGPRFMANRKPFKLKGVLIAYNAFQVLFSFYMFYEHLMSGWFWDYSFICQPVDYSSSAKAMRMANLCWWYYISKLTEFCDTMFFVLRKKDSQVSFLHVYHHSLTPLETWILVKFIPGGHGTFSNIINNFIHVLMYLYFMISAMGPEYRNWIWWKKYLTTLQLAQFTMVFIHSAQILWVDCGYPKLVGGLLLLHSTIFFALFSNFYYQSYKKKPKVAAEKKKPVKTEFDSDSSDSIDDNQNKKKELKAD